MGWDTRQVTLNNKLVHVSSVALPRSNHALIQCSFLRGGGEGANEGGGRMRVDGWREKIVVRVCTCYQYVECQSLLRRQCATQADAWRA